MCNHSVMPLGFQHIGWVPAFSLACWSRFLGEMTSELPKTRETIQFPEQNLGLLSETGPAQPLCT